MARYRKRRARRGYRTKTRRMLRRSVAPKVRLMRRRRRLAGDRM